MVTLASSTIRCIVRELGGPTPVSTYDLKIDYGATADGVTHDDAALLAFQAANAGETNFVRLYLPTGSYLRYLDGADFLRNISKLEVLGDPPVADVWQTDFTKIIFVLGSPIRETNRRSVRLEAAAQGATVLTVKDRDISGTGRTLSQLMALFTVGEYIAITEYDLQRLSFPPNAAFFDIRRITAIGINTITIDSGLSRAYSDLTPEYNVGTLSYCDQGGPATAYALETWYDAEVTMKNILFKEDGSFGFAQGGRSLIFDTCNFETGCWPSGTESTIFRNCKMVTTEVDKVMQYVEIDNCTTTGSVICQSYQPTELVIRDSTLYRLNGCNNNILVENTTIQDQTIIGPTSYGWGNKAVFTNCVFNTVDYTVRSNSLAGVTFETGGLIRGFQMEIGSKSGTPTVGQTLTGGSSGVTATVTAIHPDYPQWLMLGSISGTFTPGEAVSTPTMTGTNNGNIFGHEWCGKGAKLIFGTPNFRYAFSANVLDFYRDGQNTVIATDATSWPSYSDGALTRVFPHYCPDFTMTGCTGNDIVEAWSQAPSNITIGQWSRFWLKNTGAISTPPPIFGRVSSITVAVTTAYTGSQANLYLALDQFGVQGLRLPGGGWNTDRLNVRVDLRTAGTRVFSPSGNTGIQGSDVTDDMDYIMDVISPLFLTSSGGTTAYTGLAGESSSVWPEFTVTIVTEI